MQGEQHKHSKMASMSFASKAWSSCTCIQHLKFHKQTHNTFCTIFSTKHAGNASRQGQKQEMQGETNENIRCNSQSIKQCRKNGQHASQPSNAEANTTHRATCKPKGKAHRKIRTAQHTHTHIHQHHRKHNSMQAAEHNNAKGTIHSHTKSLNISKSACQAASTKPTHKKH